MTTNNTNALLFETISNQIKLHPKVNRTYNSNWYIYISVLNTYFYISFLENHINFISTNLGSDPRYHTLSLSNPKLFEEIESIIDSI